MDDSLPTSPGYPRFCSLFCSFGQTWKVILFNNSPLCGNHYINLIYSVEDFLSYLLALYLGHLFSSYSWQILYHLHKTLFLLVKLKYRNKCTTKSRAGNQRIRCWTWCSCDSNLCCRGVCNIVFCIIT